MTSTDDADRGVAFVATREDQEYADNLYVLDLAVKGCIDHSEQVALLISTCRNEWLTANAAFVDLRYILERPFDRELVDLVSERLAAGDTAGARKLADEAAFQASQASDKLAVWSRRDELWSHLQESVSRLDTRDRDRVTLVLSEHEHVAGGRRGNADGGYLSISRLQTSRGRHVLELLRRTQRRLSSIAFALGQAVSLEERRQWLAATSERAETQLFFAGDDEPAGLAWTEVVDALSTSPAPDRPSALEDLGLGKLPAGADATVQGEAVESIFAACEATMGRVRGDLSDSLRPNVAVARLPAPFVLDFTPKHPPLGEAGTSFGIEEARANVHPPPDEATVALLCAAVPEESFADGPLYQYVRTDARDDTATVTRAALCALENAADAGADVVVMPECFLPYDRRVEVEDVAEQLGVGLIAGVEHQGDRAGRAINEVAILTPGGSGPIAQRKQRPSIYELRSPAFAADGQLRVCSDTALGTLAIIVCSDYLELDVLWAIASHDPRPDTLVVCSRNPHPTVFEALASADAARLHANVIVVNSCPNGAGPPATEASSEGTIVICPSRSVPRLEPTVRIPLDLKWMIGGTPTLEVFRIPIAGLAARQKGRTRPGYLAAPAFVRGS